MEFQYDDGGRAAAGFKGLTGDCVVRAIAIATGQPYQDVYDAINYLASSERKGKRKRGVSSSRSGVYRRTYQKYLEHHGWTWTPLMFIGSGCKVHLVSEELPTQGTYILSLSRHLTTLIDGVLHDTHDPRRGKTYYYKPNTNMELDHVSPDRCVYGYYSKGWEKTA